MSLSRTDIKILLEELNSRLIERDLTGELAIYGGAAMALVYNARNYTKDIDAVFEPRNEIRDIAFDIAKEHDISIDWLNDAVRVFESSKGDLKEYMTLSNLRICTPTPEYLFAMKALSSRTLSFDLDDMKVLADHLDIKTSEKAMEIIEQFYPKNFILQRTVQTINNLFDDKEYSRIPYYKKELDDTEMHQEFQRKRENIKDKQSVLETLEKGIGEVFQEENFKKWLEFSAKMYTYSPNNSLLIWLQKPSAWYVKGFNGWKKDGRFVKKGEKAIKIIAPCTQKEPVMKPINGHLKPVYNEDGSVKTKTVIVGFRAANVFDISQTDGKPLPEIQLHKIDVHDVGQTQKLYEAVKQCIEIPVIETDDMAAGVRGYYSRKENIIAIRKSLPLGEKVSTHIHEWAHSIFHGKTEVERLKGLTKEVKELEAESAAYMVSSHFGLDTSKKSFQYMATYAANILTFEDMRKVFSDTFDKTRSLISAIDDKLDQEMIRVEEIIREDRG